MKYYYWIIILITLIYFDNILSQNETYYWYYYVVDNSGNVGTDITLVYDSNNLPHIAYREISGQYYVKYAKYTGTNWEIYFVDNRQFLGYGRVSMDLDDFNVPNIIYHTNDGQELWHAYLDGQTWRNSFVDVTYTLWRYEIDAKVDHQGKVHMCYERRYPEYPDKISYAFFQNSSYTAGIVIDNGLTGKWNDLCLDNLQRPCVAYFDFVGSELAFAYLNQGVWIKNIIDSTGFVNEQGYYPSVTQGNDNQYYISFQSHTNSALRIAIGVPDNWIVENIRTISGWDEFSTPNPLVLDNQNDPYIAFFEKQDSSLYIAFKKNNIWNFELVDSIGNVGQWASMDINGEGLPSISYYDATNGYLRLAVASLTPPVDTDTDGIPDYLENAHGTDPMDLDSDDDGLGDGEEDANFNGLVEKYETNPRLVDSDGDGLNDGLESGRTVGIPPQGGIKGTDPLIFVADLDPNTTTDPAKFDTDGDSLGDGDEDFNHNGREDWEEPDPNNPDTDGDGIIDGFEIRVGASPLDVDSDDDGLADQNEDKNLNGIVEASETSPGLFDTDQDSLSDGLELGVINGVADPDGSGKLRGTDLAKFILDLDPSTTTDPRNQDSDNDYYVDGGEDFNHNGRRDFDESDPLNPDTDGDTILDGYDIRLGASPLDIDSDDDGLGDQFEDLNKNGIIDLGETSPGMYDSDGDQVSDGVESGVTVGLADPDGSGPIKGTDPNIFVADTDPNTNSNPSLWDTDGDGLSEGDEDENFNGSVDPGETHFLSYDTDNDTWSDGDERSFLSDPLDYHSVLHIDTVMQEYFNGSLVPAGWQVVDEGTIDGPSYWFIWDESLTQGSNIHGGSVTSGGEDPFKPGTYIWASGFTGADYKISFKMRSQSDGNMGIMFYYKDNNNYYRFSMNKEKKYYRVTKYFQGQPSVISLDSFTYESNKFYEIILYVIQGRIQVYLKGKRIFDIHDSSHVEGSIAFYCWKNPIVSFDDISIISANPITGISNTNLTTIKGFYIEMMDIGNRLTWQIEKNNLVATLEIRKYKSSNGLSEIIFTKPLNTISDGKGLYIDNQVWDIKDYELILYNYDGNIIGRQRGIWKNNSESPFLISNVFPNPSRNITEFSIRASKTGILYYAIYDILGRKVSDRKKINLQSGLNKLEWNGRNNLGTNLPSGIYYLKIEIYDKIDQSILFFNDQKKILLLH